MNGCIPNLTSSRSGLLDAYTNKENDTTEHRFESDLQADTLRRNFRSILMRSGARKMVLAPAITVPSLAMYTDVGFCEAEDVDTSS